MPRKDDYKPGERFSEDMAPAFPQKDQVVCTDCAFRRKGKLGATNGYCEMYSRSPGKPNGILFAGAPCQFYTKDDGAA